MVHAANQTTQLNKYASCPANNSCSAGTGPACMCVRVHHSGTDSTRCSAWGWCACAGRYRFVAAHSINRKMYTVRRSNLRPGHCQLVVSPRLTVQTHAAVLSAAAGKPSHGLSSRPQCIQYTQPYQHQAAGADSNTASMAAHRTTNQTAAHSEHQESKSGALLVHST